MFFLNSDAIFPEFNNKLYNFLLSSEDNHYVSRRDNLICPALLFIIYFGVILQYQLIVQLLVCQIFVDISLLSTSIIDFPRETICTSADNQYPIFPRPVEQQHPVIASSVKFLVLTSDGTIVSILSKYPYVSVDTEYFLNWYLKAILFRAPILRKSIVYVFARTLLTGMRLSIYFLV